MTAKALNIELNLKPMDLMKAEHLTPEFIKLNPQHTIPTLVDNDFSIWESRAICAYLVEKFGKIDDPLYPKDPKTKAVINQRLYFDMGTLFKSFIDYYLAAFHGKEQTPENFKKLEDAVELLNTFLDTTGFVAGTQTLTVADLAIFASISTIEVFHFDFLPYPRVQKWLKLMKETAPGRELNEEGVQVMDQTIKAFREAHAAHAK
jgi:glutathione S-transferase